jgi:hypothetical protein
MQELLEFLMALEAAAAVEVEAAEMLLLLAEQAAAVVELPQQVRLVLQILVAQVKEHRAQAERSLQAAAAVVVVRLPQRLIL